MKLQLIAPSLNFSWAGIADQNVPILRKGIEMFSQTSVQLMPPVLSESALRYRSIYLEINFYFLTIMRLKFQLQVRTDKALLISLQRCVLERATKDLVTR